MTKNKEPPKYPTELSVDVNKLREELQAETEKFLVYRAWEQWEDELVKEFSQEKQWLPARTLAEKLKRSTPQVTRRREKLGLRAGKRLSYPKK